MQAAEASGGQINIRAEEDLSPEDVLSGFSAHEADSVKARTCHPPPSGFVLNHRFWSSQSACSIVRKLLEILQEEAECFDAQAACLPA